MVFGFSMQIKGSGAIFTVFLRTPFMDGSSPNEQYRGSE